MIPTFIFSRLHLPGAISPCNILYCLRRAECSVILADELAEVVVCITADYIVRPATDRRYVPAFVVGIIQRFAAVGSCRCDRVYERSFVIVSVLVVQVGIADSYCPPTAMPAVQLWEKSIAFS